MKFRHSPGLHGLGLLLLCLNACSQIAYRHMNDPERDIWQQPKTVIQALHITEGSHVADLGAGGGYFTFLLAEAVGPDGKVYVVDTDEASLRFIDTEGMRRGGMPRQMELTLAEPKDPRLPSRDVDLIFTCNTYHHLPGSLFGHATSKDTVRQEMETAWYRLTDEFDFLPKQHFQVFAPNTHE